MKYFFLFIIFLLFIFKNENIFIKCDDESSQSSQSLSLSSQSSSSSSSYNELQVTEIPTQIQSQTQIPIQTQSSLFNEISGQTQTPKPTSPPPLCPEIPDCPCICEECGPPETKKTSSKHIFTYVSEPGLNGNYTYFEKDPSIKWDSIDTIALYGSRTFNKNITCLAHRNKVKIVFIVEEADIFDNFGKYKDGDYFSNCFVNTTRLLNTLKSNNVDGFNLDFEYGNRFGKGMQFADLITKLNNEFKASNKNYQLSSAMTCYYGSSLKNQLVKVAENLDYFIIMGYDFINSNPGSNVTSSANSPLYIREIIKNYWIQPLSNLCNTTNSTIISSNNNNNNNSTTTTNCNINYVNKVILALPFYGYVTKCVETTTPISVDVLLDNTNIELSSGNGDKKKKPNAGSIFNNNCTIGIYPPQFKYGFKSIYQQLYKDSSNQLSSGLLWNVGTSTIYSNYRDKNGDLYQINYDSPYTIYKKISNLGIGGIGCWTIEKIRTLPLPIIDSFYTALDRNNL